jgi:hypothetical protein
MAGFVEEVTRMSEVVDIDDDGAVFDEQSWEECGMIDGSEDGGDADTIEKGDTFFKDDHRQGSLSC